MHLQFTIALQKLLTFIHFVLYLSQCMIIFEDKATDG